MKHCHVGKELLKKQKAHQELPKLDWIFITVQLALLLTRASFSYKYHLTLASFCISHSKFAYNTLQYSSSPTTISLQASLSSNRCCCCCCTIVSDLSLHSFLKEDLTVWFELVECFAQVEWETRAFSQDCFLGSEKI